jgi:hypothetical protein
MNQQQQDAIDYLREENRILREELGGQRLRLNDDPRRRLASKAKRLGRKNAGSRRYDRHPRDIVGLAPEIDRPKIRVYAPSSAVSAARFSISDQRPG